MLVLLRGNYLLFEKSLFPLMFPTNAIYFATQATDANCLPQLTTTD